MQKNDFVEAERLLDSDVVKLVIKKMRLGAMEELALRTDSTDANEVARLQSIVQCVDNFQTSLKVAVASERAKHQKTEVV